jgi:release factor glutamine methyltransferase
LKKSKALFQDFVDSISIQESRDEIKSIAYLVFENVFGLTRTEILTEKKVALSPTTQTQLNSIVVRLNNHEPVQYILEESFFYGRSFKVNRAVLIPRPETEELVKVVISFAKKEKKKKCRILDIGTGSGCIAVTLALELPNAEVFAADVSPAALDMASTNARHLHADVQFMQYNVLKDRVPGTIDIIVSNPPYIGWNERDTMAKNVTDYEPAQALFVDAHDPLIFYKAIVTRARESLTSNGLVAVEINERFGEEVQQIFIESGLTDVQVIQDVLGKDRIVKGVLSS